MNKPNTKAKLRPRIWNRNEILSLLKLIEAKSYRSSIHVLNEDLPFWKSISVALKAEGIAASPEHCRRKWLLLYKAYTTNTSQQGIFFKMIEQIVNAVRNDRASEGKEEEPISNDEAKCVVSTDCAMDQYETIEIVAESAPEQNESAQNDEESKLENSTGFLQALCRKIDALAEVQRQQHERIEQIFRLQKASYDLLLQSVELN